MFLLVACCGCRLGNYEEQIDRQVRRLQAFDRQQQLLGPALDTRDTSKQTVENLALQKSYLFLRPPRGIRTEFPTDEPYGTDKVLLLYPGPDHRNLFVAVREDGLLAKTKKTKEASAPDAPETPPLIQQVYDGLRDFYMRQYGVEDFSFEADEPTGVTIRPISMEKEKGRDLAFRKVRLTPGKAVEPNLLFDLYQIRLGKRELVLVYQLPEAKADTPSVQDAIRASLSTLAVGIIGRRRTRNYASRLDKIVAGSKASNAGKGPAAPQQPNNPDQPSP